MGNLMDDFLKEILRVNELKKIYEGIGTAGLFALQFTINPALERAKQAHSDGDPIRLIRSLNELREIE